MDTCLRPSTSAAGSHHTRHEPPLMKMGLPAHLEGRFTPRRTDLRSPRRTARLREVTLHSAHNRQPIRSRRRSPSSTDARTQRSRDRRTDAEKDSRSHRSLSRLSSFRDRYGPLSLAPNQPFSRCPLPRGRFMETSCSASHPFTESASRMPWRRLIWSRVARANEPTEALKRKLYRVRLEGITAPC
jgi:hypothetical protein